MTPDTGSAEPGAEDPASLELSPERMRELGRSTLDRIVAHLASLDEQPARGDVDVPDLCRELQEDVPPEDGARLDDLLEPYFDSWVGHSFTASGPGYMAFIPGGGLFPSVLADMVSGATNRFTGVWRAAPALVQLEANVLSWFAHWMGFPTTARALLTSGGSLSTLSAVVCARERLLGEHLREGVLYTSTQAHLCVTKAARMAGILPDRVRIVGVDELFRMRTDELADAIAQDRARGLRPFLVASSAGTTNTGAVDPLDQVADLCAAENLWHHVDGAYGAFFHMCPELRPLLAGLSRADSLTLDPHKGLFLPYGNGALLVRDGEDLRAAHAATASYLPEPADGETYDPSQYGPEMSRDYRGLRVWLAVKLLGAARLRAALTEKRDLAVWAGQQVARLPGVVMDAAPQLSLFAFHLSWPGGSRAEENAATHELIERVVARQRVMLTGCTIEGRFLARVCVLSFRTRRKHVEACVEDITAETEAVLEGKPLRA